MVPTQETVSTSHRIDVARARSSPRGDRASLARHLTRARSFERFVHGGMIGAIVKLAGFGVGYCYPTYSALKLLDRKVIGPEDVTLWLTYFIVAFSLVIGESIGLVSWYVDDRDV